MASVIPYFLASAILLACCCLTFVVASFSVQSPSLCLQTFDNTVTVTARKSQCLHDQWDKTVSSDFQMPFPGQKCRNPTNNLNNIRARAFSSLLQAGHPYQVCTSFFQCKPGFVEYSFFLLNECFIVPPFTTP